jgi:sugar lactone lactonase YvrE
MDDGKHEKQFSQKGTILQSLLALLIVFTSLFPLAPDAFPLGLERGASLVPSGVTPGLLNPSSLWFDKMRGYLVVANTHGRQVLVLNRQGQTLRIIGKVDEMGFPVAIAGDREGTLYIAERGSESLKVITSYDSTAASDATPLDLSGYRRSAPVQPVGLYVDDKGKLFVIDRGNRQILVFSPDRKRLFAIGDAGDPSDVWVEPAGNILVADPGFGGIRVFNPSGVWLKTLGADSDRFREPLRVKGFAVDRRGRIWSIEEGGRTIKALDSYGNQLLSLPVDLETPVDLALDERETLYILEQGANRISVFYPTGF